jgi:hypothetical protein
MRLPQPVRLGLAALLLPSAFAAGAATTPAGPAGPFAWPAPTQTARPWARWWWLGSAVDAPNLERLLAEYRQAGLGGVEICPIYGAKGYEKRFTDYLSPAWMDMLAATTRTATGLGMGVDLTTGTGWPMGGPWVPADQASESVSLQRYGIESDGRIPESSGILAPGHEARAAGPGTDVPGRAAPMDGIVSPAGLGRLLCLRAVGPDGTQIDLTDRVRDGRLDWTAPGPGWSLFSLRAHQPAQKVKRAAPGGAGNVVDPYSIRSLDTYLSRFDQAFQSYAGAMPRAAFQDSFEYFGANWTPDFPGEFARRRGYDLRERLPALAGDGDEDTAARVREDYRRTIGELHQEYVAHWTSWSHAHGSLTREQAHGAPANIEDVYATADIPETEGSFGGGAEDQVPMLKFASSAAHVTGRTLASSETFTWLGEHFQVPLSQLKPAVDAFYLSGINHMFFHGIPYSPADAPWPGWLFYASVNFGPNGGLWHDLPAFNAYATRCQSILQSGRPDNDVLLYFPVSDYWQQAKQSPGGSPALALAGRKADPLVEQFTTPGKWMLGTPFHGVAMELWHRGFGFDEVTDSLLLGARVDPDASGRPGEGPEINLGGNHYRAVVVPPCRFLPVETLRMLVALAQHGATVVFAGSLPSDVPGLADLGSRRSELRRLREEIPFETRNRDPGSDGGAAGTGAYPSQVGVRTARLGKGLVVSGSEEPFPACSPLSSLLETAGIPRERMTDDGLLCVRRLVDGGTDYFIVNSGTSSVEKWVSLARSASSAVLMDPLYPDRAGFAGLRHGSDGDAVLLQMAPGQSFVLRTFTGSAPPGPAWRYLQAAHGHDIALGGNWGVHFVDGGPVLPRDFRASALGTWTDEEDPEAKRFAGTAVYSLRFALPDVRGAADWRLDLGRVADSARVRVNGAAVATLWCAPFAVEIGRFLKFGDNLLEVEVTNVAANRIRDLDLRHVDWKSFYEINFVSRKYGPFDASGWPVRDSGLLGPVRLTPMTGMPPEGAPSGR